MKRVHRTNPADGGASGGSTSAQSLVDHTHSAHAPFEDWDYARPKASLTHLFEIAELVRPYSGRVRRLLPLTILLGMLSVFVEGASIAAILLLLAKAFGSTSEAAEVDGWLGLGVDWLVGATNLNIAAIALVAIALAAARIIVQALSSFLEAWLTSQITHEVRSDLFHAMTTMDFQNVTRRTYGECLTILDRHSWSVAEAIVTLNSLLLTALIAIGIGALLFWTSPVIAIIAVAGTLLVSVLVRMLEKPAVRLGERNADAARTLNTLALRSLQAMRTLRAFGLSRNTSKDYRHRSFELRTVTIRADFLADAAEPITQVGFLAIIAAIAVLASAQGWSFAILIACVALLHRLHPYVSEIEQGRLHLVTLLAPIRLVMDTISEGRHDNKGDKVQVADFRRSIEFENVSFAYDEEAEPFLDQVNFSIPAGRWTRLVGDSGSGKTSILNLILGLYEPQKGRILLDGGDLTQIDIDSWRGIIGIAGQDVELIDGTIEQNIRLANPAAPPEELERVLWLVGLDKILPEFAEGLNTRIGERGASVSGGQRQRIGIARAILRRPKLLILDEATSALDQAAQQQIYDRLTSTIRSATVLVIGHHLFRGDIFDNEIDLRSVSKSRRARSRLSVP